MVGERSRQAAVALAVAVTIAFITVWGRERSPEPGAFIPRQEPNPVPGQLIVRFRDHVSAPERSAILAEAGASLEGPMLLDGYVTASVPPGTEEAAGRRLAQFGAVASVEQNGLRFPAFVPNDEFYPQQWNMPMIQMEQAWDVTHGAGATVAVVDTGVAYEDYLDPTSGTQYGRAPDLAGTNFVFPYDIYAGDPHANDDLGHGTHVAGTIAEATNNGVGVSGIAFEASVMPIKVCGKNPIPTQSYGCPNDKIADGIKRAVDYGAGIINLSLGGGGGLTQAEKAALTYAQNAGVVVIAAAGNNGSNVLDYPAAYTTVIAVGAVGMNGVRAGYSNYGIGDPGHQLDLVAPGGDPDTEGNTSWIYQNSYLHFCAPATPDVYTSFAYCPYKGTSMSAAHVSGVAALVRSKFPSLTPGQVRTVLTCSALDLGPPGTDLQYGAGLVQAYNALRDDDGDGIPNCLDSSATPTPPVDECPPRSLTPTPTPTLTPTPTPMLTATPSASETGSPTPTPTLVRTPLPSGTAGATGTAAPTDTATPTPTATPSPSPTASPSPEPSPSGSPSPTPTPTQTPTPTAAAVGCGDVDCSGVIDSADALWVLRYVAKLQPYATCLGRAYVDCDSTISSVDALIILRYVAKLPLSLPEGCAGPG